MQNRKKLKLCFIANLSDNHSRKWIKYFIDKDYDIHWISLPSDYKREVEGYQNVKLYLLKNFRIKLLNVLLNIGRVRKLIKEVRPTLLHIQYAGVNGVLGALSGFHPFLVTAHGSDILVTPKSPLVRPLIKFVLKKADLITCDAEHLKKTMERLGANPSKVKIICFGVDTQKFSPGERDKALMKKLDILDKPAIISLRYLKPIYDLESLIRALPLVLKDFPEASLLIGGEGFEKERLMRLAKDLGILKNTRFLGWIPEKEIPRYLRSADIYVSTSLSDAGIASSTAEAMACGLPVVVTDFGANSQWIKDGENGFLVPLRSPRAIAEKIILLLKDKDKRMKFGDFNRKIIEERNNYYREMGKIENLYEEIASEN